MTDAPATGSTIGIVDGERADALADAVATHGGDPTVDAATALADADVDVVVAPTEPAVYECVRARTTTPVLAVDGGPALHGVPRRDAETAIQHLLDGAMETASRRTLAVDADDAPTTRALADVTLITSEPARISEYAIHTATDTIATFRADGVVLATPVGTQGYARAAGSHVLAPHTGVIAAVPVAPFATDAENWVLPDDEVGVTVERDEGDISLRVDDRHHATLTRSDRVTVTPDDPFALAVTPVSTGPWPDALEKH